MSKPQTPRGDCSAFRKRSKLCIDNLFIDSAEPSECREPAIGSRNNIPGASDARELLDALGDEHRVFDEVGRGIDNAGDKDLVLEKPLIGSRLHDGPLMRVARIGVLEEQA